jgi:hypothetical protein
MITGESWTRDSTGVALTTPMQPCFCKAASDSSHCFKETCSLFPSSIEVDRLKTPLSPQPQACRLTLEPSATVFMPCLPQ